MVEDLAPQSDWQFAFGARNHIAADNHYVNSVELEVQPTVQSTLRAALCALHTEHFTSYTAHIAIT